MSIFNMKTIALVTLFLGGLTCVNASSKLTITNDTAAAIRVDATDDNATVWQYYVPAYTTVEYTRPQTVVSAILQAYTVPAGVQIGTDANYPINGSWHYTQAGGTWQAIENEDDYVPTEYLWGMVLAGFGVVGAFIALMAAIRVTRSGERMVFQ